MHLSESFLATSCETITYLQKCNNFSNKQFEYILLMVFYSSESISLTTSLWKEAVSQVGVGLFSQAAKS